MRDKIYRKDPNFVTRMIDQEMVLVPIKHDLTDLEKFYALNELGTIIWNLMDGRRNLAQIKARILEQFEAAPERIEADLDKFIKDLTEIECIQLIREKR